MLCSLVVSEQDSSTTVELAERQCSPVSPSRPNVEKTTADVSVSLPLFFLAMQIVIYEFNMCVCRMIMRGKG